MSDKRPTQLTGYIEAAAVKNDELILEALCKLEDPTKRGKLKLTVASLCLITKLSRNTIRNRPWALERLKAIKTRQKENVSGALNGNANAEDSESIEKKLRGRIKNLLEQNAILYAEILSLRRTIARKDAEINENKARRLNIV